MATIIGREPRAGKVRLARGCWLDAELADDLVARCAAAVDGADDVVISSITAARLHGLWLPPLPDVLHVATSTPGLTGRSMTRTRRPELVAHRLQLDPDDVTVVAGVRVMTAARAWRDLAGVLDTPGLVAAGDSVLRMGVTVDELAAVIGRTHRARYATAAKLAVPLLDGRSRSRPESHLRVAVVASDLPNFAVNEPVYRAGGGWLAEPDLSLEAAKLALEYQGEEHAQLRRMRADITRERDMRAEGWLCLLFGPREVFGRPWTIGTEVRAVLADRAPHLLGRRRGGRP